MININISPKLWIISLVAIILGLLALCVFLFKLVCIMDISVEPIHKQPDLVNWENWPPKTNFDEPRVYLVSYADGSSTFFQNQNALVQSALNKGVDFFLNYKRSHLSQQFYDKNKHILDQKFGAGLWLWKPWIILDALNKMPEDSILIYMDVGLTIHSPLQDIIHLAQEHNIVVFSYPPGEVNMGTRTKRDVFVKVGCDNEDCRNADYIQGGFLALKNNVTSRKFISDWLKYCSDESLLSRSKSIADDFPEFTSHGDDQSILGVVYYKNPVGHVMSQTELTKYMSHHRRKITKDDPYTSLLYDAHKFTDNGSKKIRGFEAKILNSKLFIYLRKFVLKQYYGTEYWLEA